ncbi:protein-tyrosine phosphatase-like protein [Dactylonectria macrodidyma]|uniref:Protein-tyrosine phosphatase-like protein n=1 Tax=Dactylonectria macrodidyma TaxID=307937 RepID=A0A9P9DTJ6_9HYPO|nr:protein-tyrosine phosphatase-like protein [Dactylonectria macrodidyma]
MSTSTTDTKLLASIVTIPVEEPIPSELLTFALSNSPFITLPGSINIRDIGTFSPGIIKPRTVFRSGSLDFISESDRPLLRSRLGLSKIYDFRRKDEVKLLPIGVEGVELVHCPYMDGTKLPSEVSVATFAPAEGEPFGKGYRNMYDDILKGYTTGYRRVFESLKTAEEGDAVLFHCTAGKDRTGVMAALILDLMGASAELIADEYALTRVGTEAHREKLLPAVVKGFGDVKGKDDADMQVNIDSPGMRQLLGTHARVMIDFVEHLRENYGGAEGYMKGFLRFSDEDILKVRDNLRPNPQEERN